MQITEKNLNVSYYIAKRLVGVKNTKNRMSQSIIKIGIAAVAMGVFMMILSVSTGVGLQQKIRQKVAAFNGHLTISHFDDNQSEVSKHPISIHQDFYPDFSEVPEVAHLQGIITKAAIIRTEETFEGVIFKGVGKDFTWAPLEEFLVAGQMPVITDTITTQILISEYIANRLQLGLSDKVQTYFLKDDGGQVPNLRVFEIVGIYNSGFQEFDATYVLGDIKHLQRINRWDADQIGAFEVFVKDFKQIKTAANKIYEAIDYNLDTKTIYDKYYHIFEWLTLFDFNIVVILVIMMVVATINMVVTLLVLILERTQMIGILKSIGANHWMIRKIFLYHAFYIILRGLAWGNGLALLCIFLQGQFGIVKLNPENYYVTVAPVDFNLLHILLINLGTVVVTLLVLILPSVIITKISPIKAMKFD